ncbi:Rpn family recombination-promoting nuclease/putative transposase [Oceanospirillum sediminis]|uniref:Rpn family recombination-promoting nuclease/putative transposase n=1 Tax=Oceanospirillum sediminis TaxID=2760088 RepID=A0A839IVL8_9GAMM|nr:Rpn family recombination-promoting nuclease/putative transposase [Oceanospirillum sediminis]MBB1488664.1 Rpn family recombination-promoting nuclease/putative transposase [Oceanospirillum sediminis]
MLLDPKNDYVFKRLFAEAPDLLVSLINDLRPDLPQVQEVEVLNPNIEASELTGKYIILDILAKDTDGQQYNVEMQVRRYNAWGQRSLYYLARMLSDQLDAGREYHRLKAAVGIHLLDFDLFDEDQAQKEQAIWRFEMRDSTQPDVLLGNELQLNIIELKKADRLGIASETLNDWITFFEHWQEDALMATITHEPIKKAMDRIRQLSADDEEKRLALVRERALHDEATLMYEAREEGREEGLEEGYQKAQAEAQEKIEAAELKVQQAVLKMLSKGFSVADVADFFDLTADAVQQIQEQTSH